MAGAQGAHSIDIQVKARFDGFLVDVGFAATFDQEAALLESVQ